MTDDAALPMNVPLDPRAARVDLPIRSLFAHEPQNFTRWLERNLDALSVVIGLPLQLMEKKAVGDARIADLLARDRRDGSLVIVENQLEPSDDAHFGQVLSYFALAEARAAVWIAPIFRPSHLAAMQRLNELSGAAAAFFAVQVRAVQVGGGAPAIFFQALVGPQLAPHSPPPGALLPVGGFAAGFWAAYDRLYPEEAKRTRALSERCRWRASGVRGVVIAQLIDENAASVFLRGSYGKTLQDAEAALAPFAWALESRIGVPLRGANAAMLAQKRLAVDATNPANWPAASEWLRREAAQYGGVLARLPI